MPNSMNTKQKIFAISGLVIILFIFFFFLAIKPMVLEIQKVSAMVSQSRDRLLLIEQTDENYLKQIEFDYKEIVSDVNSVKSGLISSSQAVEFFMDLEETATLTSNKLEINAANFPVLELTLTGSFSGLMRFLGWLENGKYFLEIESLDIRQIGEREVLLGFSPGDVKTVIKIKVHTQK